MHSSKSVVGSRLSLGLSHMLGLALVAALSVPALVLAGSGSRQIEIITLSTNGSPHLVTGGDVLVALVVPDSVPLDQVQVRLNGNEITSAFRVDPVTGQLTGLVTGLRLGNNNLGVRGGPLRSRLTLVNHPITGPLFYGPQQQPFICETESFQLPVTGKSLGPPLDRDCSTHTRVDYVYKTTAGTFEPLLDLAVRPADLAQTMISTGRRVNYIVRIETGTINRAIYETAILHDPVTDPEPDPWHKPAGWNERLIYQFGGGCAAGYHQGTLGLGTIPLSDPLHTASGGEVLAHGYAVALSTLNVFNNRCDDVVSAETAMMVKQHFIQRFGFPLYTIGSGSSGGSMQVHLIAQNYPGLLDGIVPRNSFADTLTFLVPYADCTLLEHAFGKVAEPWTFEQKTAVGGHRTYEYCSRNVNWASLLRPASCASVIPAELVYDPVTNPGGVRCTLYDDMINVYGRDPRTGFARRPLDNVGIQYGLAAFNAGTISAEQFLELNEVIGGYDADGSFVPTRTVADQRALRIAYQTGRMNSGSGGLAYVPMIHYRAYMDDLGDVHDFNRSYIVRARLIAANGNANNQVILVSSRDGIGAGALAEIEVAQLRVMDEWLGNIASDDSPFQTLAEKVVRNKPRNLVDACYTVTGEKITDEATCRQLYPPSGNPRLAAGEPLTNDRLKCMLRPADVSDYAQPLTSAQLQRLNAIFPEGVCDYSRPGVEQQLVTDTWLLNFSDFW